MLYRERSYISLSPKGFHNIVYSDYGSENKQIIICVHGLTGNGLDFGYLAPELVKEGYRVIAIDMPGRGRSDFLNDPTGYCYRYYLNDLNNLMSHLGINKEKSIDWIGTSMGGLLGFRLAGIGNSPIRRIICNDIGPFVPQEALDFIEEYVSRDYEFTDINELKDFMKEMRGLSYGPVTEEQWLYMAKSNSRKLKNGKISYGYDPKIAYMFGKEPVGDTTDLWEYWANMDCPALVIRGGKSFVFTEDVAIKMQTLGPGANNVMDLVTLNDCGHVPSLMADNQIKLITDWLKKTKIT